MKMRIFMIRKSIDSMEIVCVYLMPPWERGCSSDISKSNDDKIW